MPTLNPGDYTTQQIQQFGLNPNETTSLQNIGGVNYRLANNQRGGRVLSVEGGAPSSFSSSYSGIPSVMGATTQSAQLSQSGSPDYAALARQQLELQQQANAPAVQSLQNSIPTTQQGFSQQKSSLESQKQPLKERYSSLLQELGRREKVESDSATLRTSNELGRRGILPNSGLGEREIGNATQPISQYYTGQTKDVGLAQNQDLLQIDNSLAALPIQEQQALNAINQSISGLQSSGANSALANAMNLFGMQQQSSQQANSLAQALQIAQMENAARQSQYDQTNSLNERQFAENSKSQQIENQIKQQQLQQGTINPLQYIFGQGNTGGGSSSSKPSFSPIASNNTQPSSNTASAKGSLFKEFVNKYGNNPNPTMNPLEQFIASTKAKAGVTNTKPMTPLEQLIASTKARAGMA